MTDSEGSGASRTPDDGVALLAAVLGCPVAVTEDPAALAADLAGASAFDAALQPSLAPAALRQLMEDAEPGVVYELRDPLGVMLTLFRLGPAVAAIGPYTGASLHADEAESLLGRLGVPGSQLQPYRMYRARFALVDSEYVMRGAQALLHAVRGSGVAVEFRRIDAAATPRTLRPAAVPHSASLAAIEDRYAVERDYMDAVTRGDFRDASAALGRMAAIPQHPGYLNTPYLGATIMRILTRVAALEGGLPPVSVDAISQTYAQRLHSSGHNPDRAHTQRAVAAMAADFCRAVARHRQRPYSRLVRRVVDEIELHLSDHVSPPELAARLGVSPSHLARRFKAETGHTIAQYAALERTHRAAHLLTTTDQPVRDIAAYVGYPDANYFVKAFRATHGMTPTQFRALPS